MRHADGERSATEMLRVHFVERPCKSRRAVRVVEAVGAERSPGVPRSKRETCFQAGLGEEMIGPHRCWREAG